MERVLKHTSLKSIVLLIFFLCLAQSSFATTVTIPSDDDMLIGARAIIRGKVVAIESSLDERSGRIFTYITVKVQEVYKGQITEQRVVLKELGGQVGDRASVVYGNPRFKRGEKVLLYLDTWADGSLRTYQMFLGKFNIEIDSATGEEVAVRSTPDENTTILKQQMHGHGAPGISTEKQVLRRYVRMVRNRLSVNWQRSMQFDAQVYSNKPLLAEPAEFRQIEGRGEINPNYTFLGPFRFFEPDTGQPVTFALNPNPSGEPGVPQVSLDPSDVMAAGNAWSNVTGCSLQMSYSGPEEQCYLGSGLPGIHIVSNNCDGRNGATVGCASILAWGGISQTGFQTIVINGTTFSQSIQGFVSMNPWANCSFTSCNVREILTHEIGHALGLGHSQFSDATMAPFAHFDGRCASIRTDDINGICAIYPGSGGGPGPLTVTTTSLASGTVGSSYSRTLSASGGTLPYTWSLVQGLGTLPPGLSLSGGGVISGTPNTEGTYNFTVRVTDNPGATADKALSIVVSPAGGGGPLNSQFVSQNVPTTVQPGHQFTSTIRFLNTGTQTWSGSAYYYASQNPALNQTWGGNAVSLAGFFAAPGQIMEVSFTATAPTTAGTYNFQWQMYQNGGVGFFGQMTTNVAIQVGTPPPPPPAFPDTIGLYNPAGAAFFLRNSNTGGVANLTFSLGPAGLGFVPIVGDWDGDGVATIGLYDPANGAFFLRNSNSSGMADLMFGFGPGGLGFVPIAGDWDGDGIDTIGLYDPVHGGFFLRNSNTSGVANVTFAFGPGGLGFVAIVGDWNGDGVDTIGLYDPAHGGFFLRNANSGGVANVTLSFGPGGAGFKPIAGDWNGDGVDTIGLYDPAHGGFFLKNTNSGSAADATFSYGPGALGFVPIVGDWDGL